MMNKYKIVVIKCSSKGAALVGCVGRNTLYWYFDEDASGHDHVNQSWIE